MADYLELARKHLGLEEGEVLDYAVLADEVVIVADFGIKGCPKYRVPLTELEPEPEPEPEDGQPRLEAEWPDYLSGLDYRELQDLAKSGGIPANQSADDLRAALAGVDLDALLDARLIVAEEEE